MQPVVAILLALAAVILTGQILARVLARFGQPAVIGEVLAGILLGPSIMGPEWSAWILPPPIAPLLRAIAHAGVVIYMFIVGLELETSQLRARRWPVVAIGVGGVAVPFACGAALAAVFRAELAPPASAHGPFIFFAGIAMAVTAFPVLARILKERAMDRTPIGAIAISAAAVGDVLTWCLLAAMVGLTGIHASSLAIVGAFLLGVALPAGGRAGRLFGPRVMRGVTVFLLPAFFAFTGMRTRIDLLDGGRAWMLCGIIVVVAVVGKFAGGAAGARAGGLSWRDATVIGILMNTRGLMELVVLNIGLELGLITPLVFAMMVVMALATTMMTGPLLRLAHR